MNSADQRFDFVVVVVVGIESFKCRLLVSGHSSQQPVVGGSVGSTMRVHTVIHGGCMSEAAAPFLERSLSP